MLKESRPKFLFSIFWSQNRVGAQLSKFVWVYAVFDLFLSPVERVNPYLPPTSLQKSSAAALYMLYIDIKGLLKESRPKFLFSIFWSQNRVGGKYGLTLLAGDRNRPKAANLKTNFDSWAPTRFCDQKIENKNFGRDSFSKPFISIYSI